MACCSSKAPKKKHFIPIDEHGWQLALDASTPGRPHKHRKEKAPHHLGDDRLDAADGQVTRSAPFSHALVKLARQRPEVIGMTADLGKYTDLHIFKEAFPNCYYPWAWPSNSGWAPLPASRMWAFSPSPPPVRSSPPAAPTTSSTRRSRRKALT